jgi:hypothetical protein
MQKLIDYNKVEDIIRKSRNHHVEKFCEYKWSSDLTIDDVIVEANTTKALELALRDIKATVPSNDDIVRVNNAVIVLANFTKNHDDVAESDYYKHVKTIADYLGLTLPNKDNKDNEE